MPVPVLLVTGFLGAGKTTAINHLLTHAEGRRIAAVVNDFGAINIDAELIAGASEGVVSLANGCICCSLEGDLLRTIATLLRRDPRPEFIVIETSGVADPADIVRNVMDPVVWREAPLETVLCVVDAGQAAALHDPLLAAQVRAADVIALTKADLAPAAAARRAVAELKPGAIVVEATNGQVPAALLLADPDAPRPPRDPGRRRPRADRFETTHWTADRPLSLPALQAAIERLAPRLARAKGVFEATERPGRPLLLQFAGGRATLAPAGPAPPGLPPVRLVFITEIGALSEAEIAAVMAGTLSREDPPCPLPPPMTA